MADAVFCSASSGSVSDGLVPSGISICTEFGSPSTDSKRNGSSSILMKKIVPIWSFRRASDCYCSDLSRSWTNPKRKCVFWVDVYHDTVRPLRFRFRFRLRLRLHSDGSNRVQEKSELPSVREMIDRGWNRESLCHHRRRGADRSKRNRRKKIMRTEETLS